jgi:hypothetical protein
MTSRLTLDAEALARLDLDHTTRATPSRRARPFHLATGVHVLIPAPRDLAAAVSLEGLAAYRSGGAIVVRPAGSSEKPLSTPDAESLAAALLDALSALPLDVPGVLRDLALFAEYGAESRAYALDVVRAFRRSLKAPPASQEPSAPRGPAMSTADRQRAFRVRVRAEEIASAAWALTMVLDDEDGAPEPGAVVLATDLRDAALDVLGRAVEEWEDRVESPPRGSAYARMSRAERLATWAEEADDDALPPFRPRLASPRRLYDAAEALGLTPTTSRRQRFTVPNPQEDSMTRPLFTPAEILAEIARQEREAVAEIYGADALRPEPAHDFDLSALLVEGLAR